MESCLQHYPGSNSCYGGVNGQSNQTNVRCKTVAPIKHIGVQLQVMLKSRNAHKYKATLFVLRYENLLLPVFMVFTQNERDRMKDMCQLTREANETNK